MLAIAYCRLQNIQHIAQVLSAKKLFCDHPVAFMCFLYGHELE
jgi:hypothetical protein